MTKYRQHLPQLDGTLFIADGGLETTLIFHEGIGLPYFAAFDLLNDETGVALLRRIYARYLDIARQYAMGIVLDTPTWRANPDWGEKLGYGAHRLAEANRKSVALLADYRQCEQDHAKPIVISGCIGPRGDGYRTDTRMSAARAYDYHAFQVDTFAQTQADMIAAYTLNYSDEAIGIVLAARMMAMPVAISFTVETNGRLPSGESLPAAIARVDDETDGYPLYYMLNCAHPSHFEEVLREDGSWRERLRGLRANASKRSHAELDESTGLDDGNPQELAEQHRLLFDLLPNLAVVGGCCGTDHRHVAAICAVCVERDAEDGDGEKRRATG
jgi:S-methylmethionine-dependent homocysteine/selenocysteine methylase